MQKKTWGRTAAIKIGDEFTHLKVIGPTEYRDGEAWVPCRCVCKVEKLFRANSLVKKTRNIKSCGCKSKENRAAKMTKHGMARRGQHAPEWKAWMKLRARCTNPKDPIYPDYGGRGITVCVRWQNSFSPFFADMGSRPTKTHSIDRIDNEKGYWCGKAECPECGPLGREPNCRWATKREQSRNSRHVRWLSHNGETMCLKDWASRLGIADNTLTARLAAGWPLERALTAPRSPQYVTDRKPRQRKN